MTSVGYKLYREVRDAMPPDWTVAERVVAWVIADDAREESRRSFIRPDLLCHRTGLSPTGLRGALQRLSKRGYEFRVIRGIGSDGRPVYSARGYEIEYQVPDVMKIRCAQLPPEGDARLSPLPVDKPP